MSGTDTINATATAEAMAPAAGLTHLPLALFAVPMGVGGLGLAWREAAHGLGAPMIVGEILLLAAGLLWLLIAALHVRRLQRHPAAVRDDLRHPIRSAFAGAVTIGLMLMAAGLIPYARTTAGALWLVAAAGHVAIAAWTLSALLSAPREAATLTPPLLIPLVGNIVAPIFGMRLGFEALSWLMFGIGATLWLILQPLLFGRLITGPPLPPRLRPTLAILMAPPAVAAVALAVLTGGFGPASLALFGAATLFALALAAMARDIVRVPFALSWWSWTFPAAVVCVAAQGAARAWPAPWQGPLLWLLLLAVSAIVGFVGLATVRTARAGHLLRPET